MFNLQPRHISTLPSRMLDGRALVAAHGAARPLPQYIARRVAAPSDHRHGARTEGVPRRI